MKQKNQFRTLGMALLLAASFTACSSNENEPDGLSSEAIQFTPDMGLSGWQAPDTRADQKVPVTFAPGGEIEVTLLKDDGAGTLVPSQMNRYEVLAGGKLSRLAFAGKPNETQPALNVPGPGKYSFRYNGTVNCQMNGIPFNTAITQAGNEVEVTITNGKVPLEAYIAPGGIQLNALNTDGTPYSVASDITATLKNVQKYNADGAFETKTLNPGTTSAIWGDIGISNVPKGTTLLELAVGGKTYKVNAPRQISIAAARLYTFKVRIGATEIIVGSDDLGVGDFEVQPSTDAEADAEALLPPLYEGQPANRLAIPGQTAYWVAPVNANEGIGWNNINFDTICPEGWHVPTKDEFAAMTGLPADKQKYERNFAAITAAFPAGEYAREYWSSTKIDDTNSWILNIDTGMAGIQWQYQASYNRVRCVQVAK